MITLIDLELETFPNRPRWTVETCYHLMDHGFLDGRFEVIDGHERSALSCAYHGYHLHRSSRDLVGALR